MTGRRSFRLKCMPRFRRSAGRLAIESDVFGPSTVADQLPLALVFPPTPAIVSDGAIHESVRRLGRDDDRGNSAPVVLEMEKLFPHAALNALWMAAVSSVTPSPLAPNSLMETLLSAGPAVYLVVCTSFDRKKPVLQRTQL